MWANKPNLEQQKSISLPLLMTLAEKLWFISWLKNQKQLLFLNPTKLELRKKPVYS
jgi:hypothetical protein